MVHHTERRAAQDGTAACDRVQEGANRESSGGKAWGKNMRKAAAQCDGLDVVAGAPVVAEKKWPGFIVDFTWQIDAAKVKGLRPEVFDVTRCAA